MSQTIPVIDNDKLRAEKCKRSLFFFVKEFWIKIISDEPHYNWHIEYLCKELEKVSDCIFKNKVKEYDLIINICPATTKSTLVSIMLPCWIWAKNPNKYILLNTISHTNATDFARKRRDIIESGKYVSYFPHVRLRRDSTALEKIKNSKGGEIIQFTTKGRITGQHGHIRIDDDPMAYTDAISKSEARRCIEGYKSFFNRSKNQEKTPYILVSQRLSKLDTTEHALKTLTNYKHICLPAVVNDFIKPIELKNNYKNGLLDPIRLNHEVLESIKKGISDPLSEDEPMSRKEYLSQYEQNVYSTVDDLQYNELKTYDYELDLNQSIVISASDPSGSGEDYFCSIFLAIWNDRLHIFDGIYTKDGLNEAPYLLEQKINQYNSVINEIETNQDGGLLASMLINKGLPINPQREKANKQNRIDSYSRFSDSFYWNRPGTQQFLKLKKDIENFTIGQEDKDDAADTYTKLIRIIFYNYRNLLNL